MTILIGPLVLNYLRKQKYLFSIQKIQGFPIVITSFRIQNYINVFYSPFVIC